MQKRRTKRQAEAVWMAEVLAVIWVIAVRIGIVIFYGVSNAGAASYETAMVSGDGAVRLIPHHASYIYTCFLTFLFRFLGNKAEIAALVQLAVQTVAILIFAAAVKKLIGRAASIAFLLSASVLPELLFEYHIFAPDLLLCIVLGMSLCASAFLFGSLKKGKRLWMVLQALLTGALLGISLWIDLTGLVIWLAVCIGMLLLCGLRLNQKLAAFFVLTFTATASLLGLLAAESRLMECVLADVIRDYLHTYIEDVRYTGLTLRQEAALTAAAALCLLTVIAAAAFKKREYEKTLTAAVLLAGCIVLQCFHMTRISYRELENLLWCFAGAAAIQWLADAGWKKADRKGRRDLCGDGQITGSGQETAACAEQTTGTLPEKAKDMKKDDANINYIPNPLPLPKKHVKKELGFDYELMPEQMEFDLDSKKENDDYDRFV